MDKLKTLLKPLKSLSKDVFILSAGILIAQLIPLILQPLLKRTFNPEDFGTFDVFLKSFSILVALSCLKYDNAILLPKKDSESKHVLYLCLLISSFIFITLLLIIFFFKNWLMIKLEGFTFLALLLLPFSVLAFSVFNVFNMYLIRRRKFVLSSTNKVSRRFSEGLIQVLLGFLNNSNGLIIGDMIGNVVQGAFSFWKVKLLTPLNHFSFDKIKKVLYEYRELPIFTLVPNILNTFVLGSLTFLILSKFDLQEVGYLEFTQKILAIPTVFISTAISQVVFQRVSKHIAKKENIIPLLFSVMAILLICSSLFILIIEFLGTDIFVLIGGEGWESSGEYAQILVYGAATMLIFSPLGKVLIALKKFKVNSLWEILKFIAIIQLFNIDRISINEYLKIYTLIIICSYLVYGVLIIYFSYKYQLDNKIKT
ncbi:lipopolysaccharide biosynthesis protein [Maribacter dokdonensis]|uniref:lipopolysaccharide biosynthesis protein n=1 Tax=Maribacter dokdonensis TaxID=320912 RepID=UPI002AB29806|nr:oligosaccharide flippase family protein [Maribacter dokdonensis]